MGGSDQPYIYTPERTVYPYSSFNPRAVTQAEYKKVEDEKKGKPKPDGPLVNFNAHPDSYMIVGTKNVSYKPMPARTKTEVAVIRWLQFVLRVILVLGALGMLVCVAIITNVSLTIVWIMRLAPAWDVIITLYAVYHLIRPAKARTPNSSASYHFFALFMDIGLIPFYVFIAMYANTNYLMNVDEKDRWNSVFKKTPGATNKVIYATFIGAASIAGVHFLSVVFDIWLIVLFRKISKLPPDANPLEENLTARPSRQSKHKYKNSEATLTDSITDKRSAYFSGSTVSVDQRSRLSTATKEQEFRGVPFQHSRMGSEATFSPHNPQTARWSRQQFEDVNLYSQPASARSSRADMYGQPTSPSKNGSFVEYSEAPPPPPRSTDRLKSMRPVSYPTNRSTTDLTSPARYSSPALPNAAPTNALVQSQQKQGLLNDNWISVEDDDQYNIASPGYQYSKVPDIHVDRHDSFEHQPLKMNPPTPPPKHNYEFPDADDDDDQPLRVHMKRAALTSRRDNGNGNLGVQRTDTTGSSVYSESSPSLTSSPKGNGTPKGKYYGDLATATMGVRGMKSSETLKSNGTVSAATMDSTGMAALGEYGFSAPSPPPKEKMRSPKKTRDAGYRVVSRTGVDFADSQAPFPSIGMRDRREVSGKVAEEGRGGGGWFNRSRY